MCVKAKWMLKVKRGFDLSGIYTKERAESGKIPARFPSKPSIVGFTSRRRTWGTESCKNLIRTCFEHCSARSVSWVVKKASLQSEEERNGHGANVEKSKSSFLPEKSERRISRGYCRALRPWGSLSTRILGKWPKLRTRTYSRRRSLRQKGIYWKIERWDLVIIALESMPRMKTSSTRLSRGPRRWFISKGDDPRNSVGADKNWRDIR